MFPSVNMRRDSLPFVAISLGLASIVIGKALSLGNQWINFALLGSLVLAYIGVVFYLNRKTILILYLLTIVNLDYIKLLSEPFNVTVDIIFTFTLVFLALPLLLAGKLSWRETPIQKVFLLYLAVTLVCVFLSVDPLLSIKRWFRYASYYLLICLLWDVLKNKTTIERFSRIMIYSALVPCLIGYYALFARVSGLTSENLRIIYGIDMVRIKSTFSHANTFGLYLGIIIPLSIGFLWRREGYRRPFSKHFLICMLLAMFPLLYFTFSRIGWISTTLAILLVLVFLKRWRLLTITPWLLGRL